MTPSAFTFGLMAVIFFVLVLPTYVKLKVREIRARRKHEASVAAGRNEPASIRPWVDLGRCMGSGACVTACPEDVLAIVGGQVRMVAGSKCIGHGVCADVCPVDAIELVFGSDQRGVDLPQVGPDFQTNVSGLFVAGELGGMGLIANAVEQGVQAMDAAAIDLPPGRFPLDVLVVGAGPAGIAAGLRAQQLGLTYLVVEQDEFGGAIRHYPRQKLVMTRPMELPGYPPINLRQARKEELVEILDDALSTTGLHVQTGVRVEAIQHANGGFQTTSNQGVFESARVILAIGRRGTPRKLGVPGEDHEKVTYRLLDAEEYHHQHVLVVGAGDSAVEAAVSLSEQPGNRVTLSYRGKAISRPKEDNLNRLRAAENAGAVDVLLESTVDRVDADRVVLNHCGEKKVIANDFVFVFAGGVLPTKFLQAAGIRIQRHHGKRVEALHSAS